MFYGTVPAPTLARQPVIQAKTFLEAIHMQYLERDRRGQKYADPGRFFGPDLARAMNAGSAGAKRRGKVPLLDGDLFFYARD